MWNSIHREHILFTYKLAPCSQNTVKIPYTCVQRCISDIAVSRSKYFGGYRHLKLTAQHKNPRREGNVQLSIQTCVSHALVCGDRGAVLQEWLVSL